MKKTICPRMSDSNGAWDCVKEHCEWWIEDAFGVGEGACSIRVGAHFTALIYVEGVGRR